jgi:hypothetical protein
LIHGVVEDPLENDIEDYPGGEQSTDGLRTGDGVASQREVLDFKAHTARLPFGLFPALSPYRAALAFFVNAACLPTSSIRLASRTP